MRQPILLDNPPSDRRTRFMQARSLSMSAVTAGGIAAVLGASVALALLVPFVAATDAPAAAELRTSVVSAAPVVDKTPGRAKEMPSTKAPSAGVQYVGDVKQPDRPCEEQTWPYIATHCLKPAADRKAEAAAVRVAVDRSELKVVRAGMPSPASAPAAVETPEPALETAPASIVQAAVTDPVPLPIARPVGLQTASDPDDGRGAYAQAPVRASEVRAEPQIRRSRPAAREARDIRPDRRGEMRRAVYRDQADRQPSPVIRRWTEAEYEVPGPFGGTRRVVVIRQHPVHQAAAFSDER